MAVRKAKQQKTKSANAKGGQPLWLRGGGRPMIAVVGVAVVAWWFSTTLTVVDQQQQQHEEGPTNHHRSAVSANPAVTDEDNDDSTIDLLVDWMRDNGAFIHPNLKVVQQDGPSGRGVVWTGPETTTAQQLTLFDVPQTLMLTSHWRRDPRSKLGANDDVESLLQHESDQMKLALVLLAELQHLDTSYWKLYLNTLPPMTNTSNPLFWSSELLQEFQSHLLVSQIQGSHTYLKAKYQALILNQPQVRSKFTPQLTYQDFLWAFYLTSSRTFFFPSSLSSSAGSFNAMVPFADLPNHAFQRRHVTAKVDVVIETDTPNNHLRAVGKSLVHVALKSNERVLIEYQPSQTTPSAKLLHRYGMMDTDFRVVDNDFVRIVYAGHKLLVGGNGRFEIPSSHVMDGRRRFEWCTTLANQLDLTLLSTSLQEDVTTASAASSAIPNLALAVRIRYKNILYKTKQWLQAGCIVGDSSSGTVKSNVGDADILYEWKV